MRVVLGTHSFRNVAGSETYLLTVAEHLQRLGHEVTIHAVETGPVSDLAVARGIPVAGGEDELPEQCDVVLTQDAGMAHALAERYPRVPQALRAPSELHDVQLPPMIPGTTRVVVVVSDRVARRIGALDPVYPVVRLRHPIDTERLMALGAPRARPRRVVLLGNYLQDQRRRMLEETWGAAGIEIRVVGSRGTAELEPAAEIAEADIVVGKGRAILDAMSCARPAYVYDDFGTDGWVTPEAYPAMEADGFAGQSLGRVACRDQLEQDLSAYDPEMGIANRDLVLMHHKARDHAHQLVGVFRSLAPDARPATTPGGEVARNIRLRWAADRELSGLRTAYGDLTGRVHAAEERAAVAEQRAADTDELLRRRTVRAGIAAGRAVDRLRRVTGR